MLLLETLTHSLRRELINKKHPSPYFFISRHKFNRQEVKVKLGMQSTKKEDSDKRL
jgi:hypothetical protein